jgi:hypothetical protein
VGLRAQALARGGSGDQGRGGPGAELAAVAAGLRFGLLAKFAGQIGELVQSGIDADAMT